MPPLLCYPFEGQNVLQNHYKTQLAKQPDFNPSQQMILPEETSQHPINTFSTRQEVLLEVYKGDYHTDSFDLDRLSQRISNGSEKVWFWGSVQAISELRKKFANKKYDTKKTPRLGTVTVLPMESLCGKGYGELCRSGSVDKEQGAKSPSIWRSLNFMEDESSSLAQHYHTLTAVSRTRASTKDVRGGEAVHKLHMHYLRSRFWGVAPWYVMQGGVLEFLDYREINRNGNDVLRAIQETKKWYFPTEEEALFAQSLCKLNYGISPEIETLRTPPPPQSLQGTCLYMPHEPIAPFNPAYLAIENSVNSEDFEKILKRTEEKKPACIAVRIQIDDEKEAGKQVYLKEIGFRMTFIIPPKNTTIFSQGEKKSLKLPVYAIWCRPRKELPLEYPYYLTEKTDSSDERTTINYIKGLFT